MLLSLGYLDYIYIWYAILILLATNAEVFKNRNQSLRFILKRILSQATKIIQLPIIEKFMIARDMYVGFLFSISRGLN